MKIIIKTAISLTLIILTLSTFIEADISASNSATATVVDPIGFKPSVPASGLGSTFDFIEIIRPRTGVFLCQISRDNNLVTEINVDSMSDFGDIENQIMNISVSGADTMSVTIIYTEN